MKLEYEHKCVKKSILDGMSMKENYGTKILEESCSQVEKVLEEKGSQFQALNQEKMVHNRVKRTIKQLG